ncbi:uncharacterized protein LOC105700087 [Orussus abietinus]|uniref:uncharacterized protein LOC105700087 n=1 Tax=Orussus abietinus TaxID=222816 RepID=UPI0006262DBC|nr:uncharacterized protein LOC105700087 [Orussus abietinus]
MDSTKLHRYYRSSGYDLKGLIYRLLITDNDLRLILRFSPYCGMITFVTCVATLIVVACAIFSSTAVNMNKKAYYYLQDETTKKLPRKESISNIRPAFKCIQEHLKLTGVFQKKIKRMLCKEKLEIDIMNSRIHCINELLKPETQSQWRKSRSPKVFCRNMNSISSK